MIYGNVGILLEGDAIESCGQGKHATYHILQFEIGAQHFGINVVAFFLEFVGIVGYIPGFE